MAAAWPGLRATSTLAVVSPSLASCSDAHALDLSQTERDFLDASLFLAEKAIRIATDLALLAAHSETERSKHFARSLLLAVELLRQTEAIENTYCSEALDILRKGLQARPGLQSILHTHEGSVWGVAFSPNGKILATGYAVGGK